MNCLGAITFLAVAAVAAASGIHGIHGGAVIAGPSGAITSNGVGGASVVGPTGPNWGGHGGVGIIAPGVIAGRGLGLGLAGHGLGLGGLGLGYGGLGYGGLGYGGLGLAAHVDVGHGGLVGSGIEGQWVPDINEHLYDDGSYKPHVYGH